MLTMGHFCPNMVEYPEIAGHIKDAIDEVYRGGKLPEQALDAASRSSVTLGWSEEWRFLRDSPSPLLRMSLSKR